MKEWYFRISTIIHEARYHSVKKNIDSFLDHPGTIAHDKKEGVPFEFDTALSGAYGFELLFLTELAKKNILKKSHLEQIYSRITLLLLVRVNQDIMIKWLHWIRNQEMPTNFVEFYNEKKCRVINISKVLVYKYLLPSENKSN